MILLRVKVLGKAMFIGSLGPDAFAVRIGATISFWIMVSPIMVLIGRNFPVASISVFQSFFRDLLGWDSTTHREIEGAWDILET